MAGFEFLAKCPVFEKCQMGVIKEVFNIKYCRGSRLEH